MEHLLDGVRGNYSYTKIVPSPGAAADNPSSLILSLRVTAAGLITISHEIEFTLIKQPKTRGVSETAGHPPAPAEDDSSPGRGVECQSNICPTVTIASTNIFRISYKWTFSAWSRIYFNGLISDRPRLYLRTLQWKWNWALFRECEHWDLSFNQTTPRVWQLTSEEELLRRDPLSCVAPSLLLISLHPLMQFSLFGGFLLPYCARLSLTEY